jgi:hypothetical protein
MVTNGRVFADLSCDSQKFKLEDNVPDEANEVDDHV